MTDVLTRRALLRRAAASKATLARLGQPLRLAYGTGEIEKLDIHKTSRPNAPRTSSNG